MLESWVGAANSLTDAEIEAADDKGAVIAQAFTEYVDDDGGTLPQRVESYLLDLLNGTAESALERAESRGSLYSLSESIVTWQYPPLDVSRFQFTGDFDRTNPRAVTWAATRAGELITEIGDSVRDAIRDIVAFGHSEGFAPRRLVRYIRESVGLRSDQVLALQASIE